MARPSSSRARFIAAIATTSSPRCVSCATRAANEFGVAPRMSAMARETAESADVVRRLLARQGAISDVARALDVASARLAVICGRGSSGHAGVYLRYLIETRLGLPVSATAPSVTTALHRPLKLEGALFIVISQSGESPDLVAATQAARDSGA